MSIYNTLAQVYHEMYQSLFDYDDEFKFYASVLENHNAKSVIEFGCGTGNLASRFIDSGYDYLGVDLNQEMLDIVCQNLGQKWFFQANMRDYQSLTQRTEKPFDLKPLPLKAMAKL